MEANKKKLFSANRIIIAMTSIFWALVVYTICDSYEKQKEENGINLAILETIAQSFVENTQPQGIEYADDIAKARLNTAIESNRGEKMYKISESKTLFYTYKVIKFYDEKGEFLNKYKVRIKDGVIQEVFSDS